MPRIIYIAAGVILAMLMVAYVVSRKLTHVDRVDKRLRPRGNGKNKLRAFYIIYTKTPAIRKYFYKVMKTVESIYPADPMSINKKATEMMTQNVFIAGLIGLVVIFMGNGDIFYTAMGLVTSLVFFDYRIMNKLDRMERELLKQLQGFLSDIRHHYMSSKIVEDAVEATLDEIPFEISLHIQRLYDILISPIMEEKVEEYAASSPNRFFMLLTSICSVTKEYGDTELETGSNFLGSLAYLKEEINTELLRRERNDHAFRLLPTLALMPVLLIKPVEFYCRTYMTELAEFYDGLYGKVIMVSIFVAVFACYKLVEILKDSKRGELKNESIFSRAAETPVISRLTNRIVNRYYTRMMRLNDDMKEIGDQTGPKAFLVQSAVFGIAAFLVVTMMFTTTIVSEKVTMLRDFYGGFDESIVPNKRYVEIMQNMSNEYANTYKRSRARDIDTEALAADIKKNSGLANPEYARMVAEAVVAEVAKYQDTYYKWWHLLLSVIALFGGCFIPYGILKFKIRVASMNKDDEINQYQTLVLILMHTEGITINTILEWMDRFAYSFKPAIETCIFELEHGERQALERLKMSEDYPPFRRFCDCLIEVDQIGIVGAFDEVASDRAYSLKEREQQNIINTDNRSSEASVIALIPAIMLLGLYLVGPMFMLASQMFSQMNFDTGGSW